MVSLRREPEIVPNYVGTTLNHRYLMPSAMRYLVLALAALVSAPVAADLGAVGGPSLMASRDKTSRTTGYGLDFNVAAVFFNASLSLRHWESEIMGWNDRRLNDEGAIYVGLGFGNLIQVQRGFSNAGTRNRIRSDIVLSDRFPFYSEEKWGRFRKGIVLTPFVETGSGKKVYGLGIGLLVVSGS
jgi:hypothetical protein